MSEYGLGIITGVLVSLLGYLFVNWLERQEDALDLIDAERAYETYLKNGEEVAYIDLPDEVKAYFDTPGNILKKADNAENQTE